MKRCEYVSQYLKSKAQCIKPITMVMGVTQGHTNDVKQRLDCSSLPDCIGWSMQAATPKLRHSHSFKMEKLTFCLSQIVICSKLLQSFRAEFDRWAVFGPAPFKMFSEIFWLKFSRGLRIQLNEMCHSSQIVFRYFRANKEDYLFNITCYNYLCSQVWLYLVVKVA